MEIPIHQGNTMQRIYCPRCGDSYVKTIGMPVMRDGDDCYRAHRNVRGDVIVIQLACETCGDSAGELMIGFHKGETFLWIDRGMPEPTIEQLGAIAAMERAAQEMIAADAWQLRSRVMGQRFTLTRERDDRQVRRDER